MNSILEYLERTAKKDAWKTGVDDGNVCLSWKEIMEISKKIGTAFTKMTSPGKPIALLMDKSAVTLAAMFGAAYAGCFYAVIDPNQPVKRIQEILHVLSPAVILADKNNDSKLDSITCSAKKADLKNCLMEVTDDKALNSVRQISKITDPLYCMFTSGSTGTPKGITVSHKAVIDFISHFTEIFSITEKERIGNQAPFDFDVSVKDIYSCVFTGATLILVSQKLFTVLPELLDYLCEKRVTTLIWAVSALTLVSSLKGLDYRVPPDLKKIMFSGEVMPVRQLRLWQEALPKAEFVNLYGPSEITCNCTYYHIDRLFDENEKIPIGRPFPGREVFLIDENGSVLSENGITGEICVAGESLSDGYYHAPEETEKRFCHDADGRLFYKSGDLGYRGEDGELYFVGRKDFQVKIMGRRIELEEVELALNQLDGVQKCCCLVNKKRNQLIAYYSGEADGSLLRSQLREILPLHMIPQKLVRMDQIPLNKNGKTDRALLQQLMEGTK